MSSSSGLNLSIAALKATYDLADNFIEFKAEGIDGFVVYLDLPTGPSCTFKVQYASQFAGKVANSSTGLYDEVEQAVGGAITVLERSVSAAGKYAIPVDLKVPVKAHVRVSFKGTVGESAAVRIGSSRHNH